MRNGSFPRALATGIDQANLMALACPVDAHKPFNLLRHSLALSRIAHSRAAATPQTAFAAAPICGHHRGPQLVVIRSP